MSSNTVSQQIFDVLVSRNLDPNALDLMGKDVTNPAQADLFSFEYKTENKNYGTVVILVDGEKNMELYYGDNIGRTMEENDKSNWYDFLYLLRNLAKKNLLTFSLNNMNKLKHNMKTMAAVTEGKLLEGYYGSSKTSYSNQPMETKLIIKHSRALGEDDARFRNIKTLFVQTSEGERFKLPFTSLTGGKAMARHVAEGGNPYDAFGQHIAEMISEMATLQKFVRASRNKGYNGEAGELAEQAVKHYASLKRKAKRLISRRGYHEELETYDPITITDLDETVNQIRDLFVQHELDTRVENALPVLAKLKEKEMKELNEFESWVDSVLSEDPTEEEPKEDPVEKEEDDDYNAPSMEEAKEGEICSCCNNKINKDGTCGCGPECKHCGGKHDIEEIVDLDTGKQALKAQRDPMLEDELETILKLAR
jgi:hypothetical protein